MKKLLSIGFVLMTLFTSQAQTTEKSPLDAFPQAKEGTQRVVIELPKKGNEEFLKVEITVGKDTQVDKCNHYFMMGNLKKETVKGYGYDFFEFNSNGTIAGTKMMCQDTTLVTKFVSARSTMVDYNSKLPLVIYVPNGMKVKYKIWKAPKKWKDVQ